MNIRHNLRSIARLFALLAPLLMIFAGPQVAAEPPAWCGSTERLSAEGMPERVPPSQCDLRGRIVDDHGVGIRVPPPGQSAAAEAVLTDGWTEVFTLATEADGTVVLSQAGSERAAGRERQPQEPTPSNPLSTMRAAQTVLGPCSDNNYGHTNFRETSQFTWFFRASTAPSALGVAATEGDLRAGMNAIVLANNDCGRADTIGARHTYGGDTTFGSGLNHTGVCETGWARDGRYVVDFGNLPEQWLAMTCYWGTNQPAGWVEVTEADIKFRASAAWYTGSSTPSTCFQQYSVRGMMTHEAGHVFGMGHVLEATSPHLTMSELMNPCTLENFTLGRGDHTGLEILYPVS